MGKIKSSSLGSFSGKIGNVVTYVTRGKNIVRIYTDNVANPQTNKQKLVRARFAALGKLSGDFLSAIELGYSYRAKQHRNFPLNNFFTANWDAVSASSPDDVTIDYSSLTVADGPIGKVAFGNVDWGAQEHLTIVAEFTDNTGAPHTDANDDVYIFAYVPELGQGLISSASTRSTGSVSIVAPAAWNGMTAHLWGFAVGQGDETAGKVSDSSYIGHDEIQ